MSFNLTNTLARAADNESQISLMRRNLRPETVFRLKIAVFALFCPLDLVAHLCLIFGSSTRALFGWLNNPFFGWVRDCGWVARALYCPAFAGALLARDPTAPFRPARWCRSRAERRQMAAGCL